MPPDNPFSRRGGGGGGGRRAPSLLWPSLTLRALLVSAALLLSLLLLLTFSLLFAAHTHTRDHSLGQSMGSGSGGGGGGDSGNSWVPAGWPPLRLVKNKYDLHLPPGHGSGSSSGSSSGSVAAESLLPPLPPPPPLPVAEVIKNQLAAIHEWEEALDTEEEGELAHGNAPEPPEPAYHNPLPPHKTIHEVIKDLFLVGKAEPEKLLQMLKEENPLGIPKSSQDPLDSTLFMCPTARDHLISFPDLVDHSRASAFRDGQPGSWVFYQHLRKAGGTGFCDLAKKNLKKGETPPYYCMVDNKGSLATPPWNNEQKVLESLHSKPRIPYRITSNEWDIYETRMGAWSGAVLATTFRHPVDRWFSQYRFEHLEHRDGSRPDAPRRPFRIWYKNNHANQMGSNYYTNTFIGEPAESAEKQARDLVRAPRKYQDFYWTYHQFQKQEVTLETFEKSLATVRSFNLVLVTEWLNSASKEIDDVLGWKVPPKRVLPHQNQASRKAADMDALVLSVQGGGDFESYVEEKVGRDVYKEISLDNIFDVLLFHCAKRLYLERLHDCSHSI